MDYENLRANRSYQRLSSQSSTNLLNPQSGFTQRPTTPPKPVTKVPFHRSEQEDRPRKNMGSIDNIYPQQSQVDFGPQNILTVIEKDNEEINKLTPEELNRELDANKVNDIIILLNRRRSLILNKKRRLQEEFYNKIKELQRYTKDDYLTDLKRVAPEDPYINSIVQGSKYLPRMNRIVQTVIKDFKGSPQDRKTYEMSKSQDFWQYNKGYENSIDNLLKRLKNFDQELDKDNVEIYELCRSLDSIDDSIKDLLVSKVDDHVNRAEPLFNSKQKQQGILNNKLQQRNKLKDEKMGLIYKIIEELNKLKNLREDRLRQLGIIFGDEDLSQNGGIIISQQQSQGQPLLDNKVQAYSDFLDQLDNVTKMRDQIGTLEGQESGLLNDLEKISRDNDLIFNDLVRKQSEEAKVYNDWTENLRKRLRYIKGTEYFFNSVNLPDYQQQDFKEVTKKFKENLNFLKPFVEEDAAIRQGLSKTNETMNTFTNIIKAIENEKERRRELLNILESCARLRADEDIKTEQMRNIELDINKKTQQKRNLEEDLDGVLGDADLNTFKKIENILQKYDNELQQLQQQKLKALRELEDINSDVINQLAIIKNDYDDILREILPSNWMNTYDLKKTTDLKQMKNYLKKTFKRFGIIQD